MDRGAVASQLRTEAWAQLEDPTMSMDDAVAELEAAGCTIVEVDHAGRRVKVADSIVPITPAEATALGFPATTETADA